MSPPKTLSSNIILLALEIYLELFSRNTVSIQTSSLYIYIYISNKLFLIDTMFQPTFISIYTPTYIQILLQTLNSNQCVKMKFFVVAIFIFLSLHQAHCVGLCFTNHDCSIIFNSINVECRLYQCYCLKKGFFQLCEHPSE